MNKIEIKFNPNENHHKKLQDALNKGGEIHVCEGIYTINATLKIYDNTTLSLDENATITLADNCMKNKFDFLISNADRENGNSNIVIDGGIWDGNCIKNKRGELFGGGYSGTLINFFNAKNLTLKNMTIRNPECYYIRLCKVCDFLIENIFFKSNHLRQNQDGVHLAGFCENGVIRNLIGTKGSPNDDFVALSADDCLERLQNLGSLNGYIKNIVIDGLVSPKCHSFVRLLSVASFIKNVKIKNIKGCCDKFAINCDGARYCNESCRLIDEKSDRYYNGTGVLENIDISNMEVKSKAKNLGLILIQTNCYNFKIANFKNKSKFVRTPTFYLSYCSKTKLAISKQGKTSIVDVPTSQLFKFSQKSIDQLSIDCIEK